MLRRGGGNVAADVGSAGKKPGILGIRCGVEKGKNFQQQRLIVTTCLANESFAEFGRRVESLLHDLLDLFAVHLGPRLRHYSGFQLTVQPGPRKLPLALDRSR